MPNMEQKDWSGFAEGGADKNGWRDITPISPPPFKAVQVQHVDDLYPMTAYRINPDQWLRETEGPEDSFYGGGRHEPLYRPPTHWQPLPPPPEPSNVWKLIERLRARTIGGVVERPLGPQTAIVPDPECQEAANALEEAGRETIKKQTIIDNLQQRISYFDDLHEEKLKQQLAEARAEIERKDRALEFADRNLTNLQPHIVQACIPGKAAFIDNYVDPVLERVREALATPAPGKDSEGKE